MHVYSLTQLYASERWWQEKLPAPASAGRTKLFSDFMSQRAALHLPDPDKSNYWRTWLYYKPDSVADIEPFEWEEKPEDCLTEEQAHEIWLSRGCKFIHSWDSFSTVIVQDCMMFGWLR